MILYYALGGGWGHLNRSLILMDQLKLQNVFLLHNATLPFSENQYPRVHKFILIAPSISPQTWIAQLQAILEKEPIKKVFIDSFPNGLFGEWSQIQAPKVSFFYIARLVHWQAYIPKLQGFHLKFQSSFYLEKLSPDHFFFMKKNSLYTQAIQVQYPKTKIPKLSGFPTDKKIWLIAHTGPIMELEQLWHYAQDVAFLHQMKPQFWICGPQAHQLSLPKQITIKTIYPICPFFELVDQIFTACGFNSMQETRNLSHKHCFIPFPRRYDNQFQRAANRRALLSKK